ncbi:WGR domain-containing protein [Cupriavidus basilensis]|uniref:WGR domain-containing protein n=1 Tax=Cupriavidus basilensis TaxID=68895 RepID=UPI00157B34B7|nr:WGR domain-containing protein [Cupriavidus basilensis]NUA29992.1 WGR domain-containing protein [Cupriavidus basilensis]
MRRFEFRSDSASKFWEVEQDDARLNLRWGKIGTHGQSQSKPFADAAKAAAAMTKLIAEKTGKGYVEAQAAAGSSIGATAQPAPAAVPPAAAPAEPLDPMRAWLRVRESLLKHLQPVIDASAAHWQAAYAEAWQRVESRRMEGSPASDSGADDDPRQAVFPALPRRRGTGRQWHGLHGGPARPGRRGGCVADRADHGHGARLGA